MENTLPKKTINFWIKKTPLAIINLPKKTKQKPNKNKAKKTILDKRLKTFMKLSKIGFSMKCFTANFLQFSGANVKIFLLGDHLGTCYQI